MDIRREIRYCSLFKTLTFLCYGEVASVWHCSLTALAVDVDSEGGAGERVEEGGGILVGVKVGTLLTTGHGGEVVVVTAYKTRRMESQKHALLRIRNVTHE